MRCYLSLLACLLLWSSPASAWQSEPDMAARLHAAAEAAWTSGRADEARAAWTRVLERDPKHLRALAGLAKLARQAQPARTDEAL